MKSYIAKEKDIVKSWYLVDAKDKILGRVATRIARILRGKHKAIYTPHVDTGDFVVVINADKIKVTGKKLDDKIYRRFTGYPSGLREKPLKELLAAKPAIVMHLAVKRMLPNNTLSKNMLKKLKVYKGEIHPHQAQNPKLLEV
ncbi:MAG: 50S ribosomal protein L13 [Candidatus Omnitrophota bacterium]